MLNQKTASAATFAFMAGATLERLCWPAQASFQVTLRRRSIAKKKGKIGHNYLRDFVHQWHWFLLSQASRDAFLAASRGFSRAVSVLETAAFVPK
jgi:hypothetical protein